MIAAPPERLEDPEVLEGERRQQYLRSLETKLDRLQGSNKQKLTSKDIVSSVAEAREDHMRQLLSSEASNNPWTGPSSAGRNDYTDVDLRDSEESHRPRPRPKRRAGTRPSVWTCCYSGAGGGESRQAYNRARFQQSLDEEHAYLMDYDDLELSWKSDEIDT